MKKSDFLSAEIEKLGLTNCEVVVQRAEICGHLPEYRESFDCCTSRAVAELRVLLEYAMPLLRVDGQAFFWKGNRWEEELEEAANAMQILGGTMVKSHKYIWPNNVTRMLLNIRKEAQCPEKYPRRAGIPSKRPL